MMHRDKLTARSRLWPAVLWLAALGFAASALAQDNKEIVAERVAANPDKFSLDDIP